MNAFVNGERAFGSSKNNDGFKQPVTPRFSGFSIVDAHVDRSEADRIRKDHAARSEHGMDVCGPQPTKDTQDESRSLWDHDALND